MYNFSSKLWWDYRWVSDTGEASIYLQVYLNGQHREFPLKFRWPIKKVDKVNGVLLPRDKHDTAYQDYNMAIRQERARQENIVLTYRLKHAPIDILTFAKEAKTDQRTSFAAYMFSEIHRRHNRKEITHRTQLNHLTAYYKMVEFDPQWNFEMLSVKLMKRFKTYLLGKDHAPDYVWTLIKTVKAYLQLAKVEVMYQVDDAVADFKNPLPVWRTTFLNTEELRRLMLLYRQGYLTPEKHAVLAGFLFTCFTSLRISDLYRSNAEWRVTDEFLDFIPKKNERKRKWVHVPLVPMAKVFIQSMEGKFFTLPSEGEYNKILKGLARDAHISKVLTSHVGRHTFGYLYMTTAGNLMGLKEIMGHSKLETTERYAHLDDEYTYNSAKLIQGSFSDLFMMRKLPK